jgi:ribonuclease R
VSISKERVLSALKSGGDKSLHTMEVVTALGFPRQDARKAAPVVREALEGLKSLGLAKELPGSRWKAIEKAAGQKAGKASRVRDELVVKRAEREQRLRGRVDGTAPQRPDEPADARDGARREGARRDSDGRDGVRRGPLPERVWGRDTKVGWLAMTTRGFAFVTIDEGGEVFIPPPGIKHAMHGDRVRVKTAPTPKGFEGEVVEVISRGLLRVGGTLARQHGQLYVHPGDPRLPQAFFVEGALPLETRAGMEVVGQVTRWPEREGELPSVRVLRAMGPRGSAAVEVEKIRLRDGISEEFPNDVLQEALAFPAVVDAAEVARREDWRDVPLLTIDPKDARDHDDAVWAERTKDGFRVLVAIADVSHYVKVGTAIDREATARGCSIYLPDRAIPMLPPELSSNLASLVPDEDRLMLGVEAHLTKTGIVRSYRFVEGVMRSRGRLTYEKVARTLGLTEEGELSPDAEEHEGQLETLLAISKLLRARRHKRGALGFELPEAKILLDESGEPRDVVQQKGDAGVKRAYELIEDLMLLANETVAEHLSKRGLPAIYRVHGKPDAGKIAQFAAVAEALGVRLENDEDPTPKELQTALAKIEGTPLEGVLGYLLLRSMQQATYQVDDIGHFALAARHYLHFTSPIRRYPDLAVHRIVRALAREDVGAQQRRPSVRGGERAGPSLSQAGAEPLDADTMRRALVPQAVQASRMERRAVQVEREVQAIYRCILMKKHVGQELEGKVTSVAEHGLVVTLGSPFVEVKIPIDRIADEYLEVDPLGIALVGSRSGRRIALADVALVRIDDASIERREVIASWVSGGSAGRARRPREIERPARRAEGASRGRTSAAPAKPSRTGTLPRKGKGKGGRPDRRSR